jgi:hypothetical protein
MRGILREIFPAASGWRKTGRQLRLKAYRGEAWLWHAGLSLEAAL